MGIGVYFQEQNIDTLKMESEMVIGFHSVMAQTEIARRGSMRKVSDKTITEQGKYSGKFALTNLLICGECGSPYRRRTWGRNGVN